MANNIPNRIDLFNCLQLKLQSFLVQVWPLGWAGETKSPRNIDILRSLSILTFFQPNAMNDRLEQ